MIIFIMYLACKCNMAVNLRLHHEDKINKDHKKHFSTH